jgi:SAM-dependent methyltransferase
MTETARHFDTPNRSFGNGLARCPICLSTDHIFVESSFDDRYGCPDPFSLVRCRACGHFMTSPPLTEEELPRLYGTYYPRKNIDAAELPKAAFKASGARARLQRWWSGSNNQGQYSVRPGQTVLDVGCGSGLSLLETEKLGGHAFGVEADPNVGPIADALGLRIHIGSLHDRPFPDRCFDLIVLNQVIEHIPNPGKTLDALKERLKPCGRIVFAFPNRASIWRRLSRAKWINWHVPYHLHHFDARGFKALARRHGYRVRRIRTITPNVWTDLQLRALHESPELGVPNPLWGSSSPAPQRDGSPHRCDGPAVFSPRRILRALLRRTARTSLILVNRAVDLVGYGDSIMIELEIEGSS